MPETETTYRDLRYVMGPVDVDRPEWAQGYAVGDEIGVQINEQDAKVYTVVGFSSLDEYEGQPCVLPDADLQSLFDEEVSSVALREQDVMPVTEVLADAE